MPSRTVRSKTISFDGNTYRFEDSYADLSGDEPQQLWTLYDDQYLFRIKIDDEGLVHDAVDLFRARLVSMGFDFDNGGIVCVDSSYHWLVAKAPSDWMFNRRGTNKLRKLFKECFGQILGQSS